LVDLWWDYLAVSAVDARARRRSLDGTEMLGSERQPERRSRPKETDWHETTAGVLLHVRKQVKPSESGLPQTASVIMQLQDLE
jgi:hypothetical protein